MPNLLAKGQDTLTRLLQLDATPAGLLKYTRGPHVETITGLAWVGRTVFSSNVQGASRIEFGDRDYLIPVADLVVNGAATEPRKGDRITETIDGVDSVFEVLTPNTGDPDHRYSDPGHTIWRIHTVHVK